MRRSLEGLGLSKYCISDDGKIYNDHIEMKIMYNDGMHKPRLTLTSDDGKQKKWYVAVLMMYAFQNIKCDITDIRYADGDHYNYKSDNLIVKIPLMPISTTYQYAASHISSPCEIRPYQNINDILETYGFPESVTQIIKRCGVYRGYMFYKVIQ